MVQLCDSRSGCFYDCLPWYFFSMQQPRVCVFLFLCECTFPPLHLGGWLAPSEQSVVLRQCCVSAAVVVRGPVTQRQVVCTCVCMRVCVPPRVGGLGPVLCGCALRFPVSCVCLYEDAPSRCLRNLHYAFLFEAALQYGIHTTATQACRKCGATRVPDCRRGREGPGQLQPRLHP